MSHHASTSNNNDKSEPITKEEWQSRLESFELKQVDMNKLIMNYLVTGKTIFYVFFFASEFYVNVCHFGCIASSIIYCV